MAVAASMAAAVLLYRRKADGMFEDSPYCRLGGLDFPHDVSFATCGTTELLAVAQRSEAIAIYQKSGAGDGFDAVFEISGPSARLAHSDGVAFVPPHDDYLAVCNLGTASISFFRRTSLSPIRFEVSPETELKHRAIVRPDGLAFSQCGRWLAVANHGNHTACIFQRRDRTTSVGKLQYGPRPVTVIADPQLRHPHSVAFMPGTDDLVVTNAGANFFGIYESRRGWFRRRWRQQPSLQMTFCDQGRFNAVNSRNAMEGGPKGVAIHRDMIAVCSPETGVDIYSSGRAITPKRSV
jgi:hypothetical protein